MPEIENDFSDWQFIEVDRDKYIDVAAEWNILVSQVCRDPRRKELGRLVNKDRKQNRKSNRS